jgi:hypothetical protein
VHEREFVLECGSGGSQCGLLHFALGPSGDDRQPVLEKSDAVVHVPLLTNSRADARNISVASRPICQKEYRRNSLPGAFSPEILSAAADKRSVELSAIALSGLDRASAAFDQSARAIATAGTAAPESAPVDTVDLATAVVGMVQAREDFGANIQALRTADEMQRQVLDILA